MVVVRGDSASHVGRSDAKRKVSPSVSRLQDVVLDQLNPSLSTQGLLKDQLEIVKVKSNGKIRYAIQPLDEQLSFDKVSICFSPIKAPFGTLLLLPCQYVYVQHCRQLTDLTTTTA